MAPREYGYQDGGTRDGMHGHERARTNAFDFLRLLGAMLVFVSHHFALQGLAEPTVVGWTTFGGLGVAMFFSISGYLITHSWMRDPHWGRFAARRMLRILPGLVVVVSLCALVLGPWMSTLPVLQYYGHPQVRAYFLNILFFPVYALPGVFGANPYPHAVNGSLWTLPLEFFLYFAMTPVLVLETVRRNPWILAGGAVAVAALGHWALATHAPMVVWGSDVRFLGMLAPYYMMGSFWALWGRREVFSLPVAALLAALLGNTSGVLQQLVAVAIVPYATLAVGLRPWPVVRHAARWGDFSYGLYIYAFPMQQLSIALLGPQAGHGSLFVLSLGLTLLGAVFSWHVVEAPWLARKPRAAYGDGTGEARMPTG